VIRVVLASSGAVTLSADAGWRVVAEDGRVLASARAGDTWSVRGTSLSGPSGGITMTAPARVQTDDGSAVRVGTKRYRGDIVLAPSNGALVVLNRVQLEEYLRGVVPLEIGTRDPRDRAAIEAQAVAARSFAASRMGDARRLWDVTATVSDQVYGGMDAERPEADDAVRGTRGLVLAFGDRIISAPYSAHGGPATAAAEEVWWRRGGEPFLRSVSDRAPSGGCYCDASGQREWSRQFTGAQLAGLLTRHGGDAGARLSGPVGQVRGVQIAERGPSGRVTALAFETDAGRAVIRGNDIRSVLRTNGAILPSTSFSLELAGGGDGVALLTVRGVGNGHGVGMSQWGAIGRARAGQDARTILATYYPGTRLATLE
jgi:stage II sporulation protein D